MANDLQDINKLASFTFERGSVTSAPKESATNYLSKGSQNFLLTGTGKTTVFRGATLRASVTGSKVLNNVVETFAGLGQAAQTAYGNVFNVYSALFFIGAGLLKLAGTSLLTTASSTLSLLIKRNGSYTDPLSGAFQAGLAQPSAPTIRAVTPPSGFTGKVNGVVSVVIWRVRSTTGARSIKSLVSNVVGASNQAIAVTLPLKDANGQDYWGIGVTKHTEGEVGSHFILQEVAESDVASSLTRTDVATNNASNDITSATAGFTSSHIGWAVSIPSQSFTSYVTAVPAANTLTLNDIPPSTASGQTMTLTKAVDGQARTVVIEWRDGDLLGKGFAPTRDYPPPAALFGGTLEDVAFVDGAYADAVQSVSNTVRGSAIAPSEKGRPESYSPDTVVFTNDTPTALLRGDSLYWRVCKNSTYVIRYVGGERPLSVELVWEGIGAQYQNNAAIGEGGRLYIWSDGRGLVRLGENGMPDSSFVNDVSEDLAECDDASKRVLGWDGINQMLCCCYEKRIRAYHTALGVWSTWLNLEDIIVGDITACVTVDNQLLLSTNDGTTDRLYEFNVGTGTTAKAFSEWVSAQGSLDTVSVVMASIRADNTNPVTIDVYADGDDSAPVETMSVSPTRTGYQALKPIRPNVADCESFAIRLTLESTTATGDVGIERITVHGEGNSILR